MQLADGITLEVDNATFLYIVEQSFLLVMVIGRWIIPRGKLSRDKLSALLLTLIGKACDMSDFFTLFQEKRVAKTSVFRYFVLSIWTVSVFQFPLVLTETQKNNLKNIWTSTEIWSICVSLLMQEIPFLICRSYAMGAYGLLNASIIFFTCKNAMVLIMYTYRIISLLSDMYRESVPIVDHRRTSPITNENSNSPNLAIKASQESSNHLGCGSVKSLETINCDDAVSLETTLCSSSIVRISPETKHEANENNFCERKTHSNY